jgi:hypothetical protein
MYVVIRQYEAASPLVDAMTERGDDVKQLVSSVEGFVAYVAARDGDTVTTVSVCEDRAGTDETTRRATAWVQENLPGATITPSKVTTSEVFLTFS